MEGKKLLLKGRVITPKGISPQNFVLKTEGHSISYIGESEVFLPGGSHDIYNFESCYICPGFIDIHVHGSAGADIVDGTPESVRTVAGWLVRGGTTGFLATTISTPKEIMISAVRSAASLTNVNIKAAKVLGVHLEGPFLNKEKKGAQKGEYLRPPSVNELKEYIEAGRGAVRMITIAPELPGAIEVIRYAQSQGLIVSLGHSRASITQVEEACDAGLTHVSHAFNAMAGLHHRDPGTIGAILSNKRLTVDVIADGYHVNPAIVKILASAKGINNVIAITDCNTCGGLGDGVYIMGGQTVTVREGKTYLDDGTIAGSTISMVDVVKVLVEQVGLDLWEAMQLVSANPARFLGLDLKGALLTGNDADIVVLDHEFRVLMTIVEGEVVFRQ
ncbi:N-acetylglucosamine-6-phosphate deacetylase [Phosphitispora sp. TUW77]|uniref:N-acetylglucosamine-6-phosphate deacetylase n=1 Tax=Phosphitispora sp. TUW77 TaxID=3152361 RepID=UPI003AB623DB